MRWVYIDLFSHHSWLFSISDALQVLVKTQRHFVSRDRKFEASFTVVKRTLQKKPDPTTQALKPGSSYASRNIYDLVQITVIITSHIHPLVQCQISTHLSHVRYINILEIPLHQRTTIRINLFLVLLPQNPVEDQETRMFSPVSSSTPS